MRYLYYIVFLLWGMPYEGHSQEQFFLYGGPIVDYVRAPSLLGEIKPKYGYQLAVQMTIDEWLKPSALDATVQVAFSQLGYRQALEGSTYRVNFHYFTVSPGMAYRPNRFVTANVGVDINLLLGARFKAIGDSTSIGVINTYQKFGLALRGEVVLWSHSTVSPYLGLSHALLPALKYPRIDAVGNFSGTFRDIWHRTLYVGVRIEL